MLLSAKYIFPVTSSPVSGGALLVRDDKIVDIGDFESLKLRYPDEEVMDFGMAALLPGFVDLHTKLEMSAMRGIVADLPYAQWLLSILERSSELEPSDWYDSAILGGLDALVVDPPRAGLADGVVESIAAAAPERVAYVSCNPATWARDVARFEDQGYRLASVQPVDMFPQTYHVEVVSVFERL